MSALETVRLGALVAASRALCRDAEVITARSRALRQEADEAITAALRTYLDSRPWHHYARLDGLVDHQRRPTVVCRDGTIRANAQMRRRVDLVRTLAVVLDDRPMVEDDPLLVTMQVARAYDDLWSLDILDAQARPGRLAVGAVALWPPAPPAGSATIEPLYTVQIEEIGRTKVVHVTGELDISVSERFRRLLIEASGPVVRVDLSEVTLIDASSVGALVCAKQEIEAQGHQLSVTGARGMVRRVLDLCGLSCLVGD